VVPRTSPRREQLIRAEALSRRGLLRMLRPDELTPARVRREIDAQLEHPPREDAPMPLDGLSGAAAAIDELLVAPVAATV